ncbi:hypothetical protein GDO78_022985 [Eleutherodactylus coqui]|uniref:Uncharacterized protein n=1 Tax=Eleutherodactylus coqui TaxID=57060 RepID=A0A8J6BM95_ELECQ|nr:hypothetical protein GDO78_022985 [Eleutherodactylus coqui]
MRTTPLSPPTGAPTWPLDTQRVFSSTFCAVLCFFSKVSQRLRSATQAPGGKPSPVDGAIIINDLPFAALYYGIAHIKERSLKLNIPCDELAFRSLTPYLF